MQICLIRSALCLSLYLSVRLSVRPSVCHMLAPNSKAKVTGSFNVVKIYSSHVLPLCL